MIKKYWHGFMNSARVTPAEYKANVDAMNLFFGAVLGVVMANTDHLDAVAFALTLFVTATIVVSILYVASSERRVAYALFSAILIGFLPRILEKITEVPDAAPAHLQPALAVWLGFVVFTELLPRKAGSS